MGAARSMLLNPSSAVGYPVSLMEPLSRMEVPTSISDTDTTPITIDIANGLDGLVDQFLPAEPPPPPQKRKGHKKLEGHESPPPHDDRTPAPPWGRDAALQAFHELMVGTVDTGIETLRQVAYRSGLNVDEEVGRRRDESFRGEIKVLRYPETPVALADTPYSAADFSFKVVRERLDPALFLWPDFRSIDEVVELLNTCSAKAVFPVECTDYRSVVCYSAKRDYNVLLQIGADGVWYNDDSSRIVLGNMLAFYYGDAYETHNVCVDPIRPRLCAFLVNWYAEHPKSDPPPALEVPRSPEAPTAAERLTSLGHMVAMMAQAGSTVIMCE